MYIRFSQGKKREITITTKQMFVTRENKNVLCRLDRVMSQNYFVV